VLSHDRIVDQTIFNKAFEKGAKMENESKTSFQFDGRSYEVECVFIAGRDAQDVLREKWGVQLGWNINWRSDEYPSLPPQGINAVIGTIGKHPICIALWWVLIGGRLCGFCDPCSRVVDYGLVRDWIEKYISPSTIVERPLNFDIFENALRGIGIAPP